MEAGNNQAPAKERPRVGEAEEEAPFLPHLEWAAALRGPNRREPAAEAMQAPARGPDFAHRHKPGRSGRQAAADAGCTRRSSASVRTPGRGLAWPNRHHGRNPGSAACETPHPESGLGRRRRSADNGPAGPPRFPGPAAGRYTWGREVGSSVRLGKGGVFRDTPFLAKNRDHEKPPERVFAGRGRFLGRRCAAGAMAARSVAMAFCQRR